MLAGVASFQATILPCHINFKVAYSRLHIQDVRTGSPAATISAGDAIILALFSSGCNMRGASGVTLSIAYILRFKPHTP